MFTNPAASSASQDYTIANVVLLPLFTIVDGYRRGLRRPWLYFVSSLFTSFAFAFAFYFATIERQHRKAGAREADRRLSADAVAVVGLVVGDAGQWRRKRPFVVAGLVSTASLGRVHRGVGRRDQVDE